MSTSTQKFRPVVVAALFLVQCGGADQGSSATDTSGMSTGNTTQGSSAEAGATGSVTTTDDPTTDSGGEPVDGHAPCDRYLACVAATTPDALPGAQQGYGEDGTCWQGSAEAAAQCREACRVGLTQLNMMSPDEPECTPCGVDDDCDVAGNELCSSAGKCVPRCVKGEPALECVCRDGGDCREGEECAEDRCGGAICGDGLVQRGEICDGQEGCDADCAGPLECTPLFNVGCMEGLACNEGGSCAEGYPEGPGRGKSCFDEFLCPGGFFCTEQDFLCHRYCAVGGDPCDDGEYCVALELDPPLDYIGACFLM
jgi:hypothetical protein